MTSASGQPMKDSTQLLRFSQSSPAELPYKKLTIEEGLLLSFMFSIGHSTMSLKDTQQRVREKPFHSSISLLLSLILVRFPNTLSLVSLWKMYKLQAKRVKAAAGQMWNSNFSKIRQSLKMLTTNVRISIRIQPDVQLWLPMIVIKRTLMLMKKWIF